MAVSLGQGNYHLSRRTNQRAQRRRRHLVLSLPPRVQMVQSPALLYNTGGLTPHTRHFCRKRCVPQIHDPCLHIVSGLDVQRPIFTLDSYDYTYMGYAHMDVSIILALLWSVLFSGEEHLGCSRSYKYRRGAETTTRISVPSATFIRGRSVYPRSEDAYSYGHKYSSLATFGKGP